MDIDVKPEQSAMPGEIWAWKGFQDNGSWDTQMMEYDKDNKLGAVKYVRADLYEACDFNYKREVEKNNQLSKFLTQKEKNSD